MQWPTEVCDSSPSWPPGYGHPRPVLPASFLGVLGVLSGNIHGLRRNAAHLDHELVAVGRVDAQREPEWLALVVIGGAPGRHHRDPAVVRKLEERGLGLVRGPDRDHVAVAG